MTSQDGQGMALRVSVLLPILLLIGSGAGPVPGRAQPGPHMAMAVAGEALWVDLAALNDVLVAQKYAPLPERLLLAGGLCPNCGVNGWGGWRWGGGALFGSASSSSQGNAKEATLSLDLGGAFLSRLLVSRGRSALWAGLFLGFGQATLELLDHHSDTLADALQTPTHLVTRRAFFALEPFAGLEARLSTRLGLHLQAGYLWTFGGSWELGPHELQDLKLRLQGYSLRLLLTFYFQLPRCRDPDP